MPQDFEFWYHGDNIEYGASCFFHVHDRVDKGNIRKIRHNFQKLRILYYSNGQNILINPETTYH